MPIYEYRCDDCGRKVTLQYKTYAEYDEAVPTCTHCGSTALTRLISRVAIRRSPLARIMSGVMTSTTAPLTTWTPTIRPRLAACCAR